ncbi:MAG: hypothetical protein HUU11_17915 [Anaerolineales bacterium]|nr:hypothetical protein [Anaerolineales bacterium]
MKTTSRRIVVDADVKSKCGGLQKSANDADFTPIREVLQSMLDVCHRVVLSDDLKSEMDARGGQWFMRWLRMMKVRRKVVWLSPGVDDLFKRIARDRTIDAERRRRIAKDAHVLNLAIAADGLLLSCDDVLRRDWQGLPDRHQPQRRVAILNPEKQTPTTCLAAFDRGVQSRIR